MHDSLYGQTFCEQYANALAPPDTYTPVIYEYLHLHCQLKKTKTVVVKYVYTEINKYA